MSRNWWELTWLIARRELRGRLLWDTLLEPDEVDGVKAHPFLVRAAARDARA